MKTKFSLIRTSVAGLFVLASALGASAKVIDLRDGAGYEGPVRYPSYSGWDGYCGYACEISGGFIYEVDYWHYDGPPFTFRERGLTVNDDGGVESYVYRADGRRFTAKSITLGGLYNSIYVTGSGPRPATSDPDGDLRDPGSAYYQWAKASRYDGLLYGLYGLRGNTVVTAYEFGASHPTGKIALPPGFENIDALKVALFFYDRNPGFSEWVSPGGSNSPWCLGDTCTSIEVTKMNVSYPVPVPVPASGVLLGGVLAVGAGVAHRRKRKQQVS
jgi:hypothetical protein